MLIISQNLTNYDIPIPKNAIFRVNLAWCDSIDELKNILKKHSNTKIFLDLPTKRIKPPNNRYSIEDLIPIINSNKQIHYLAISNVESSSDYKNILNYYQKTSRLYQKLKAVRQLRTYKILHPYYLDLKKSLC